MFRRTAALLGLVLLAGLLAGAPASAIKVDQVYAVPTDRTFTVVGHGFGHGHGMSQYGARGAAREGLTWRKILTFYYPGTAVGRTTDEIRVLISADTSDDVVVLPTRGLQVRAGSSRFDLPTAPRMIRWRLAPKGADNAVAFYNRNIKQWKRWKKLSGDVEFSAGGSPITLVTPSGQVPYRGALRAAAPSKGSSARDTVNVLSIDDYLKGVVPREMPASWEAHAVRAQAVAARTYADWSRQDRIDESWQICDTTSCQVYGGSAGEHPLSNDAIERTAGRVLLHGGEPAFTQYSSSSGGWTSQGSRPYLVHQKDPYEKSSLNPNTDWTTTLSAARIQQAYPAIGKLQRIRVTQREGGGDWRGRVLSMRLEGSKGSATMSGNTFRVVFGLRSTWFTLR